MITAMTLNPHGLTFASARSALLQEERRLARCARNAQATAFYATQQQPSVPPASGNTDNGKGKKKGKPKTGGAPSGGGSAAGSSSTPSGARAPTQPTLPVGPYPLSDMFQAWAPTWRGTSAGLLGPRPAHHAFPVMMAPPPWPASTYSPCPPSAQPTGWDQAGLYAALQNMSLQGGHGGSEFFLDTGASSHMANSPGILHNPSRYNSSSRVIVGNG
jgi:hypothetical protein